MPSGSGGKRVSAVIVHLGSLELLEGCLETLYHSCCIGDIECIVVDNASDTPGLEELVSGYRNACLVRLKTRSGYPAATNAGIRAAVGDYILWCNNDLLFEPGAVSAMMEFLEEHPEYGAAGPRLLNPDGSYQPSFSLLNMGLKPLLVEHFSLGKLLPHWDLKRHCIGKETEAQDVAVVTGACCMIRRDALMRIGGIDERFYMYSEEFDLCHTLVKGGWRIRYVPQACIIHLGGQTTKKAPYMFLLQARRSHYAYLLKHYGSRSERIFAASVIAGTVIRLLVVCCRGLFASLCGNNEHLGPYSQRMRFYRSLLVLSMNARRHQAAELHHVPNLS